MLAVTNNITNKNCLQQAFLEKISQEIKFKSDIHECVFSVRFNPKNYGKKHTDIAEDITKALGGFSENTINPTVSKVAKKVICAFKKEIEGDGICLDTINLESGNGSPGCPDDDAKSPHKLIYKWLWEKKFPREAWDLAKNIAVYADDRLKQVEKINRKPNTIDDDTRKPNIDGLPDDGNYFIKNESYCLQVTLEEKGNLLLIEEDNTGWKGLICPSKAYAQLPYLELEANKPFYLPPSDKSYSLKYSETGTEYFLVIITKNPIELSWLQPDSSSKDFDLNEERLTELFTLVGKQDNSQVFYKKFVVVED